MKTIRLCFCAWSSLFLGACSSSRYIYAPPAANIPFFTEKDESKLGAFYSSYYANTIGEKGYGIDLQAAYSISDHFILQASHMSRKETGDYSRIGPISDFHIDYNRKFTEGGIGFYKALSPNKDLFLQVFAGGGRGRFELTDVSFTTSYKRFHNTDVSKFYIQPALLFYPVKGLGLGSAIRFSNVYYKNIETNYNTMEQESYNIIGLDGKNLLFWEPTLSVNYRFSGFPALSLEMMIGTAKLMSSSKIPYSSRGGTFSIGANLDIAKLVRNNEMK